jgi:excisionase family DNA binding protein
MTTNTDLSTTGKAPPVEPERIPFRERLTCSVDEAEEASDLSRSMLYELMKEGRIEWTKVGARRLIKVASLLRLLEVA